MPHSRSQRPLAALRNALGNNHFGSVNGPTQSSIRSHRRTHRSSPCFLRQPRTVNIERQVVATARACAASRGLCHTVCWPLWVGIDLKALYNDYTRFLFSFHRWGNGMSRTMNLDGLVVHPGDTSRKLQDIDLHTGMERLRRFR